MIEFLCGFLSFALAIGIFAMGYFFGRKSGGTVKKDDPGEDEQARARKEREQLEQDQAAFRMLTGYSADIAYGLVEIPKEGIE